MAFPSPPFPPTKQERKADAVTCDTPCSRIQKRLLWRLLKKKKLQMCSVHDVRVHDVRGLAWPVRVHDVRVRVRACT